MINRKYLQRYGLTFHPFLADVPEQALLTCEPTAVFCFSVENLVMDGGFALIAGDPGLGKSVALRILAERLNGIRDLVVGSITRPQSSLADFYREMGAIFGVELKVANRYGGFQALREKFRNHLRSTLFRPVLLIDDAQETPSAVLNELRILTSERFDSRLLLSVVLSGDHRLLDNLAGGELLALSTRIKTRLLVTPWDRNDLKRLLCHVMTTAGNPQLMTEPLVGILAEHALGNPRIMMNLAAELLNRATMKDLGQLDEQLFFTLTEQNKRRRK